MASVVAQPCVSAKPVPARRFDRLFFSTMAFLILVTVFVGFARTYYLAGVFRAPLPNLIVHIHGAFFACWVLLFIMQTTLVAAHRLDIHRRLGLFGFCLASLMVILGLLAATDALVRRGPSVDARAVYAVPVADMLAFSTLIFFAYRARSNPAAHKRLILVATIALLDAAFVRWPVPIQGWNLVSAEVCSYVVLLVLFAYDLVSIRTLHRATLWASLFLFLLQQVRHPIGHSALWQTFAAWAQSLAR
jgi:hypothetical protein